MNGLKMGTKFNRGFTLIELIISLGIIAMISSLTIANVADNRKKYRLESAAQEFISNTRLAQHYALASHEVVAGQTPYGFGIYTLDLNTYFIFYNESSSDGNRYVNGVSKIAKTIDLLDATIDGGHTNKSIFYAPPLPLTYINGVSDPIDPDGFQNFTFRTAGYSGEITVKVRESGIVEID